VNDLSQGRAARGEAPESGAASVAADGPPVRRVDLYQEAPKIHPRTVVGPFVRLRARLRHGMLAATVLAPWLVWDDRQAILFDLPARQFHVFGLTFFPQDFILVAGLLILGAYALFTFTNWLGRVWCGYACPQSVWFTLFIELEEWIEGPRHRRIRQDAAPLDARKVAMKGKKWALWLALSVTTGVSVVGYFVPIRELLPAVATLSIEGWTLLSLRALPVRHVRPRHAHRVLRPGPRRDPRSPQARQRSPGRGPRRLRRLRALRAGLPRRHRHPRWPAVRVHQLRALHRRL
jgi:hypothetical protein